jgi:hypothetical protein
MLAALVDGTLLNTTVNPPGEGWPTGKGFQVNLLASDSNSTILAQSNQFTISAGNTTSVRRYNLFLASSCQLAS